MDCRFLPDCFGDYVVLRDGAGRPVVLGENAAGATVLARRVRRLGGHEVSDEFALKLLRADWEGAERDEFADELGRLRRLDHPHLLKYHDWGEQDSQAYLAVQYCKGGDLGHWVSHGGAFSERLAWQVVAQAARGLHYAHTRCFIHRHLKPGDILLADSAPFGAGSAWLEGRAVTGGLAFKVGDFALRCRLAMESRAGSGPLGCMTWSPEQAQAGGLAAGTAAGDIYSLGMVCWFLLAGRCPLRHPDGSEMTEGEMLRAHQSSESHDRTFPPGLSEEGRVLLARMLRKNPAERFASAEVLADAVEQLLKTRGWAQPVAEEEGGSSRTALNEQADFGSGEIGDFFAELSVCGARAPGTFHRAVSEASRSVVGLTVWKAAAPPAAEHRLAEFLQRLQRVTTAAEAPPSLLPIQEVVRTADHWCVAERWEDGVALGELVARRGRTLTIEEIAQLLLPVAEAGDYLRKNGFESALLTVAEIRLCGAGLATENSRALLQPVDQWKDWRILVSAVAPPLGLASNRTPGEEPAENPPAGSPVDCPVVNGFCRLFYRLAEGSEAAPDADWNQDSYKDANRLSAAANALLRRAMVGAEKIASLGEMLRRICGYHGIFRIRRAPAPGRSKPPAPAPPACVIPSLPVPTPFSPKPSPLASPAPFRPAPAFAEPKVSSLEAAALVPGLAGFVRSPYGDRLEQRVSGPNWRAGARIYCQQTHKLFRLPTVLPAMTALPIEGRFDAVYSPYVDPPEPTPVPPGKWKAEQEIVCRHTSLPLLLPPDLPLGEAIPDPAKPGVVRVPYGAARPVSVPREKWRPHQRLRDPASGEVFVLPAVLPAWPEPAKTSAPVLPLPPIPLSRPAKAASPVVPAAMPTRPPAKTSAPVLPLPPIPLSRPAKGAPPVVPAAMPTRPPVDPLPPDSIFICYRRDDSVDLTGRIFDWLVDEFGRGTIFKDVDSIPMGMDFRDHIRLILQRCRVVLVIMGPDWLGASEGQPRRIDEPSDYVRIEVEAALARNNLPVVPVLIRSFEMPSLSALPPSIANLAFRHATHIRRDPDFRGDIDKLIRSLRTLVKVPAALVREVEN